MSEHDESPDTNFFFSWFKDIFIQKSDYLKSVHLLVFGIFPYLFFFKSFLQIKFLILENINKIHFFVLYIEKKEIKQHMVQTLSGVPPLRVVLGFI